MIITVASFKGGVGKTTTAMHLAAFLQETANTLLVDADPNGSALAWAKRGHLPFPVVDEWQVGDRLSDYGHMVIDTQARPNVNDLALLTTACDLLILPTPPDILSLDALTLMVDYLTQLGVDTYRILLTMMPYPNQTTEAVRAMLQSTQQPMFEHSIRRYAAYQKAAHQGTLVSAVKSAKAEAAWRDYQALGQEILAQTVP